MNLEIHVAFGLGQGRWKEGAHDLFDRGRIEMVGLWAKNRRQVLAELGRYPAWAWWISGGAGIEVGHRLPNRITTDKVNVEQSCMSVRPADRCEK